MCACVGVRACKRAWGRESACVDKWVKVLKNNGHYFTYNYVVVWKLVYPFVEMLSSQRLKTVKINPRNDVFKRMPKLNLLVYWRTTLQTEIFIGAWKTKANKEFDELFGSKIQTKILRPMNPKRRLALNLNSIGKMQIPSRWPVGASPVLQWSSTYHLLQWQLLHTVTIFAPFCLLRPKLHCYTSIFR